MTRYVQNGGLTRFDTGGSHSQNPNGGIDIGNNNSVEENETKSGNFVYSNRIFLDSNIVSQYNLPKSLIGKSVADATKFIDNKFKGRNDKISQSTKNSMLSKIAEAQESMKPQEPEIEQSQESMIDPTQMAFGGFTQYDTLDPNAGIGYKFGSSINPSTTDVVSSGLKDASSKTGLGLSSALSAGSTAIDLGKTAFGKPAQDTSGLAASAPINSAGMIGGSALKGASAGMAFGPLGAGIGAAIGGVTGLLGSNKAKKAAIENTNNYAVNVNKQFSDQYAMGGEIDPPTKGDIWQTKNIVKYQPGVTSGKNGESGFYLYSKDSSDPTFNYKTDREFVRNSSMDIVQKTAQWQNYMRSKNKVVNPDINLNLSNPIVNKLAYGGKVNKMFNGGEFDPMYYENLKLTPRNTAPIESISNLKPAGTTVPYTIGTQPAVDISNANRQFTSGPSFGRQVWEGTKDTGKFINKNAGNIARYAPIAANALQLAQLKKPQGERLDRLDNRYRPEYVDEAALQNIANQTMNNSINAVGQSGASQGQLRSSIIGSQLQRNKAISDAYMNAAAQNRATNDRAQTFNLGVDQVNLQQSNTEKENYARDQAAYRNAKREYITGIGEGIGDIGKEQVQKKIIAKTTGYRWDGTYVKDTTGNIVTDPTTGKPMTEEKLKEIQSIKDKKALGGYLIKNKRQ